MRPVAAIAVQALPLRGSTRLTVRGLREQLDQGREVVGVCVELILR